MPVSAANVPSSGATAAVEDDTEDAKYRTVSSKRPKKLNNEENTHMKPMTAMTLMMEKTNSASP